MNSSIMLGTSRGGMPLYWDARMNSHCYASGMSGCGKSNLIKSMLLQVPEAGARAIVLDYTGDFRPCFDHYAPDKGFAYEPLDVRTQVGIDPFQRLHIAGTGDEESAYIAAARIADAVINTYHLKGDVQRVSLRKSIMDYMNGEAPNLSFAGLVNQIEEDEKLAKKMASALLCLTDICELLPPRQKSFRWDLEKPGITLINFASVQNESAQSLAVQMLLFELWSLKVNALKDSCPVVVVCDECQRLDFSKNSINVRLLREGRKYGLFGWYASQFISDELALNALDQVGLRIYFSPGQRRAKSLAKVIARDEGEVEDCSALIRSLKTGQFIFQDEEGRAIVCCAPNVSDYK